MSNINYNSTDDNVVEGVVYRNSIVSPIDTGSTVTAFVTDLNGTTKIIEDITILSTEDGNVWGSGRIKGTFDKSDCAALAAYDNKRVLVCVRIIDTGLTETFTETVTAVKLPG